MEEHWIFGYGSLVWRPAFPYAQRLPAYIQGWKRRFWQESTDHRGTPEQPGRVVTLLPAPGQDCWGMAYQLAADSRTATLEALDHRERQGYDRQETDLFLQSGERIDKVHIYVASAENPHFRGHSTEEEIAAIIKRSHGESGCNQEYVLRLAQALEQMNVYDEHIATLAQLLQPMSAPC